MTRAISILHLLDDVLVFLVALEDGVVASIGQLAPLPTCGEEGNPPGGPPGGTNRRTSRFFNDRNREVGILDVLLVDSLHKLWTVVSPSPENKPRLPGERARQVSSRVRVAAMALASTKSSSVALNVSSSFRELSGG